MKLSEQFTLRDICGEFLLVPLGEKTKEYNGVFALSETGAFIIQQIAEQKSLTEISDLMTEEFNIDYDSAYEDARSFTENLREYGIIVD